jgi:hypothetical protein
MMHSRRQVRSEAVRQAKYAADVQAVRMEKLSFSLHSCKAQPYSKSKLDMAASTELYKFQFCLAILVYIKALQESDSCIYHMH